MSLKQQKGPTCQLNALRNAVLRISKLNQVDRRQFDKKFRLMENKIKNIKDLALKEDYKRFFADLFWNYFDNISFGELVEGDNSPTNNMGFINKYQISRVLVIECDIIMIPLETRFIYVAVPHDQKNRNVLWSYPQPYHAVSVMEIRDKRPNTTWWRFVDESIEKINKKSINKIKISEKEKEIVNHLKKGYVKVKDSNISYEKMFVYNTDQDGKQIFAYPMSQPRGNFYIPNFYYNKIVKGSYDVFSEFFEGNYDSIKNWGEQDYRKDLKDIATQLKEETTTVNSKNTNFFKF